MDFLEYYFLGVLDILALFSLMFAMFRLPFMAYLREIGIIAVTVSLISYVMRIYFQSEALLDIMLHFVLYILFFRYLIKIRTKWAIVISLVYFLYGVISGLAQLFYSQLPTHDYTQLTQIAVAFLVTAWLVRTGRGFSFIIRPPHDVFIKERMKRSEFWLITSILLFATSSFAMAMFILNTLSYVIVPLNLLVFILLMVLAYHKDRS